MAQPPQAAVPEDDFDDEDLNLGEGAGGAQASNTNPFPNSPTRVSDTDRMMIMFQQMTEASRAASEAATAAVMALTRNSAQAGSSTQGYSDANRILRRPDEFGSANFDYDLAVWQEWLHGFKSWLVFADAKFESELQEIDGNLNRVLRLSDMSAEAQARSTRLYAIFASLLKAKPRSVLRQIEDRNGYEAYRQLTAIYAPKSKARSLALMNALVQMPSFSKEKTLREHLASLERMASEYERVSGKPIGEDLLLGTVIRCLPAQIRSHLQLQMTESTSYAEVRQYLLAYETTTTQWSTTKVQQSLGVIVPPPADPNAQDPVPMDLSRMSVLQMVAELNRIKGGKKGGKGKGGKKGDSKGKEGKGKGKPYQPYGFLLAKERVASMMQVARKVAKEKGERKVTPKAGPIPT